MSNYILGVYANHESRRVHFTARPIDHAHLRAMEEEATAAGFEYSILANKLSKQQADSFKAIQIAAYENAGYTNIPFSAM